MSASKLGATLCGIAVTGMVFAGCSSSKKTGSSTSSTTASATGSASTSAPDTSPIVIGAIGSYSGRTASVLGPAQTGIEDWAKSVNASGGINGHQVKLTTLDDAGNATTALTDVKQLIEQDHVVAIVDDDSVVDATWASYVAGTGVPVIGGLSILPPFDSNADWFPSGSSNAAQTYGDLVLAKAAGTKTAGFYCAEDPACAAIPPEWKAMASTAGVTFSVMQPISSTAASYVPQCQEVRSAGDESFIVDGPIQPVVDQCAAQGLKAVGLTGGGTITPAMLTDSAAQGVGNVDDDFPLWDTAIQSSLPALSTYKTFANTYDSTDAGATFFAEAWIAGQLFAAAVQAAPSGPVTSASIKQGLYALPQGETLGGITPPLNYQQGQPTIVNCSYLDGIQNKGWVLENPDTACAPVSLLKTVIAG